MPEYIEREDAVQNKSICRSCFHSYVCEQFNEHRDDNNKKCHFFNDHYVPAADVAEVQHGEWVHCNGKSNLWYCSQCGEKISYNPTRRTYNIRKKPVNETHKFCRNCGAKMDGKGEGK